VNSLFCVLPFSARPARESITKCTQPKFSLVPHKVTRKFVAQVCIQRIMAKSLHKRQATGRMKREPFVSRNTFTLTLLIFPFATHSHCASPRTFPFRHVKKNTKSTPSHDSNLHLKTVARAFADSDCSNMWRGGIWCRHIMANVRKENSAGDLTSATN
jgi:hypothetical protein